MRKNVQRFPLFLFLFLFLSPEGIRGIREKEKEGKVILTRLNSLHRVE